MIEENLRMYGGDSSMFDSACCSSIAEAFLGTWRNVRDIFLIVNRVLQGIAIKKPLV